jgi:chaperone required for assembly of F1-ATPase
MKRFYRQAAASESEDGWQVQLDGRAVRTQGGRALLLPTRTLAEALAGEWAGQGERIDPARFTLRDLADHAIDIVAPDRPGTIATLLRYAETDTLCYRAEPEEPLHARQIALWEPLLSAAEARWDLRFERIGGVIHRPQPEATLARLEQVLAAESDFALAALTTLTTLAASLVIGLAALAPGADIEALWAAAELEESWQADLWGRDAEAEDRRARRLAAFAAAARFAKLARG